MEVIRVPMNIIGARFDANVDHDTWLLSKVSLRMLLRVEFLDGANGSVLAGVP